MTSLNSRLQKGLAKKSAFERKCFSLFREFNQSYEYKSVSLVQEILLNWLSWSMVIMIGEQHTKQSSVYCCSVIEVSITMVINSPQLGQSICFSFRNLIRPVLSSWTSLSWSSFRLRRTIHIDGLVPRLCSFL